MILPWIFEFALAGGQGLPALPSVPGKSVDCQGNPISPCMNGLTGPACDLPCVIGDACDCALYCHSWGATYGLSTFGAYLFEMQPGWPSWAIETALRNFIVQHPKSLGLSKDLSMKNLGLSPSAAFRSPAGKLTIYRFDQSYGKFPIWGADSQVTMVTNHEGAIGIRGAIVDNRSNYKHTESQASAQSAHASILARASKNSGIPTKHLQVNGLRLVAFPRAKTIAWAAMVTRGLGHVATILVDADPSEKGFLSVLYYSDDRADGLLDESQVTVFAENFDAPSDVIIPPTEAISQSVLFDGSPLLGSQTNPGFQLANRRVAALDAGPFDTVDDIGNQVPAVSSESDDFSAPVDSQLFHAHNGFVQLSNLYTWTNVFMAGKWESALPLQGFPSYFPPGEFAPRILFLANAPDGDPDNPSIQDSCGPSFSFCYRPVTPIASPDSLLEVYRHPTDAQGPVFETIGRIFIEKDAAFDIAIVAHEFGHAVDEFAKPGLIDAGFGCAGAGDCELSCLEDSTDESGSLKESWAQLAAIWYIRSLAAVGMSPDNCAVLPNISLGGNTAPHNAQCRPGACLNSDPFSLLLRDTDPSCPFSVSCIPPCLPNCVDEDICDKPSVPGTTPQGTPTGLCSTSNGYRTDSMFQAFWELLHAQSCSLDQPYTCTQLDALGSGPPEERVGEAMLFALRVSSATYRGFADDVATFIACNYGPDAYQEANEVLCHHGLRNCGAPLPVQCPVCGNGLQEGDEDCDGADVGDNSCLTQGFEGGLIECTDACTLDVSMCTAQSTTSEGPTTDGVPTSTTPPTSGAEAGSVGVSSTSATGATTEFVPPVDEGCSCANGQPRSKGFPLCLALLVVYGRRRRRVTFASLSLVLTATNMLACGIERGSTDSPTEYFTTDNRVTSDASDGSSSETAGGSDGTSTGVPIDSRFFATFHDSLAYVGWVNDGSFLQAWQMVEVFPDGHLTFVGRLCAGPEAVDELMWTYDADESTVVLLPNQGSVIKIGLGEYSSVRLSIGATCDELVAEFVRATDGSGFSLSYPPGRVCVQQEPGAMSCEYEIVWCDEGPTTTCPGFPGS